MPEDSGGCRILKFAGAGIWIGCGKRIGGDCAAPAAAVWIKTAALAAQSPLFYYNCAPQIITVSLLAMLLCRRRR